MTERERKILIGKKIDPVTADEAAIATAIENAGSGGGSDLPSYDNTNAGNVLAVNSTGTGVEWDEPSGGELVVTLTEDSDDYTADVPIETVLAALDENKTVYIQYEVYRAPVCLYDKAEGSFATNAIAMPENYTTEYYQIAYYENKYHVEKTEQDFPNPTDADAGYVLGVDSDGSYSLLSDVGPLMLTFTAGANDAIDSTGATAEEIWAAYSAGRTVIGQLAAEDENGITSDYEIKTYKLTNAVRHASKSDPSLAGYSFEFSTMWSGRAGVVSFSAIAQNTEPTGGIGVIYTLTPASNP